MSTLRIKIRGPMDGGRQQIMLIIVDFKIKFSQLFVAAEGLYCVICNSEQDADTLLSEPCMLALKTCDCHPIMPPDLKAKRSVIVRKLDSSIYDNTENELKEELQRKNTWLKIVDLIKLGSSRSIKIICPSQNVAARMSEVGILIYHFSIPPTNIIRDKFIKIDICYKCYELSSKCTKHFI